LLLLDQRFCWIITAVYSCLHLSGKGAIKMAFFKGLLNGSGQGEPTRTVDFDDFSIDVGSDAYS